MAGQAAPCLAAPLVGGQRFDALHKFGGLAAALLGIRHAVLPLLAVGVVAGCVVGVLVPGALAPALDLAPFTGAVTRLPIELRPLTGILVGVAVLLIGSLALLTDAASARQAAAGEAERRRLRARVEELEQQLAEAQEADPNGAGCPLIRRVPDAVGLLGEQDHGADRAGAGKQRQRAQDCKRNSGFSGKGHRERVSGEVLKSHNSLCEATIETVY